MHGVNGMGMVGGLKMFPKALPAKGEALFNHSSSFPPRQGIALNRIASVSQLHAKPLVKITDKVRRQRTVAVQFLLLSGQLLVGHGDA